MIVRLHIILVAVAATLVFGWLATGHYPWAVALVTAGDWFYINLLNRITDIPEDRRNAVPGTEWLARWRRVLLAGACGSVLASLVALHLVWPGLTPWRVAVLAIGTAYSVRLVPLPRGRVRLKAIYFIKNFGSAVLFVLTCVAYPLAVDPSARTLSLPALAVLLLFFVPFELSYEVIYDLRDLEGDRAEGIPTYPVVHGPRVTRTIVDALLVASALALVVGFLGRWIGVRELLMLAAPIGQAVFFRRRFERGITARDCILITHLGTAELALYLVGTAAWMALGLPANVLLPI